MTPASPADPLDTARARLAALSGETGLPLPEVFRRICEAAAEGLGVERAGVWLLVNGDRAMRCVSLFERSIRKHTKGAMVALGEFATHLRAAGPALPCDDAYSDPRTAELRPYLTPHGITSLLDAPLVRDDRLVGVVSHEHTGPARVWTAAERDFARTVADVVVERMQAAEGALTRTATWLPAAPVERPLTFVQDVRSILAGIHTEATLIARTPDLPVEAAARVERIEESVRRADTLLRDQLGSEAAR